MQAKLKEYAKLIVEVGANVQKGQTLIVACPVECAYFGRMIVEAAYDAGAREVVMRWSDDALSRMRCLRADDAVFDEVPEWLKTFYYGYAEKKAALIAIAADDPENLKGVDPSRLQRAAIASGKIFKEYSDMQMRGDFPWCVVSIPIPTWASKVFPGESAEQAVEKLWDAIFASVHVDGGGRAVAKWEEHLVTMDRRAKILNDYNFAKLVFKNSLGTNLTAELPENHKWVGVGEIAGTGARFVANMPSEELFTLPKKTGVNGTLCSSIPLSLKGNLVKDIKFTVRDGKIIEATASEGLDILLGELDIDEGARYFGEIALVPHKSPISDMGILFYNTLFDENASCHFAFGKAYPAFHDAKEISEEEQKARGANDSFTHVDFMVGTPDLSITGITHDGKEIPVFVDGNFVF
jgi:aminopeptidase